MRITMTDTANDPAVPPTSDITGAWIAYFLHGIGLLLGWTALVAVLICHVRRGDPRAGFVNAHYTWLIRTFWWGLLWFAVAIALALFGAWPLIADVVRAGIEHGGHLPHGPDFDFDLDTMHIVRIALFGVAAGTLIAGVWIWTVYRLIRGALRLGEALPVP